MLLIRKAAIRETVYPVQMTSEVNASLPERPVNYITSLLWCAKCSKMIVLTNNVDIFVRKGLISKYAIFSGEL